jgi:hypothetical protein
VITVDVSFSVGVLDRTPADSSISDLASESSCDGVPIVIHQVDAALRKWCDAALKRLKPSADFAVFVGPPNRAPDGPHVGLHLLDVRPGSPRLNTRQPIVEIVTRYAVTAYNADDATESHRILGELLLSILETPALPDGGSPDALLKIEADLVSLQPADWLAFGVPPRPAFLIRVPIHRARALPDAPTVTEGIDVDWRSLRRLSGTVLGPNDVPLPGAEVRLNALGLTAYTDPAGRFQIASVPASEEDIQLDVRFNGRERQVSAKPGRPIVIRLTARRPADTGISGRGEG